jgi:hypothetical protein
MLHEKKRWLTSYWLPSWARLLFLAIWFVALLVGGWLLTHRPH